VTNLESPGVPGPTRYFEPQRVQGRHHRVKSTSKIIPVHKHQLALSFLISLSVADSFPNAPLRLPSVRKPLAITYGTAELPALVRNSREYHAHRAQSHCPGQLIPVPYANHFTIVEELRSPNGILTRAVMRLMEDAA
jgi:hypothetical protein